MSSTNRGYDRHAADYYVTPQKEIKLFLSHFLEDENIDRPDRLYWLDPCAGGLKTDDIDIFTNPENEMSYPAVIEKEFGSAVSTWDIREDSLAECKKDYLTNSIQDDMHDIIITNPPFYIAEKILEKALNDVQEGGYVILLLRLNFFGSQLRKPLFEKWMPKRCYVHHKRMNFITKKMNQDRALQGLPKLTGDSIEYAHFVWQKGYKTEECLTKVI